MATFDEIHDAFLFVSSDGYGMNRAVLCQDNGEIYYHSEDGVFDELDEDEFDCDNFLVIPHKNDLDLGQSLVFEFVEQQMPNDFGRVQEIFSHSRSLPQVQRPSGAQGSIGELVRFRKPS